MSSLKELMRVLLIDNYDSFTYNLYDYLLQLGTDCTVVRNDDSRLSDPSTFDIDALVLSPGPGKPSNAGRLLDIIDFFHDKVPILGICLGHQALGQYFGGLLDKAERPIHGKTSRIKVMDSPLFDSLPEQFSVMRYHSLIIKEINTSEFRVIARSEGGEIMAISHLRFPIIGIQFHPESILTEHGLAIMDNWVKSIVINKPAGVKTL